MFGHAAQNELIGQYVDHVSGLELPVDPDGGDFVVNSSMRLSSPVPSHVDPAEASKRVVLQITTSRKVRWISMPITRRMRASRRHDAYGFELSAQPGKSEAAATNTSSRLIESIGLPAPSYSGASVPVAAPYAAINPIAAENRRRPLPSSYRLRSAGAVESEVKRRANVVGILPNEMDRAARRRRSHGAERRLADRESLHADRVLRRPADKTADLKPLQITAIFTTACNSDYRKLLALFPGFASGLRPIPGRGRLSTDQPPRRTRRFLHRLKTGAPPSRQSPGWP